MYDPLRKKRPRNFRNSAVHVGEKIARPVTAQRIILFGSRSRGQETLSSDLNLLVIQGSGRSNQQVRRQIEQSLWGRRFAVDMIVATPERVDRKVADVNPLYTRHIFGEGRVLYDKDRGRATLSSRSK
jgi:predicted nucleotidyltransferase